jgi:hypothetical protein
VLGDGPHEIADGVGLPRVEGDDEQVVALAQLVCDARAQDGRLADAARAVEQRERRGEQVGDDEARLPVAAEEVGRVAFVVRDQSLIRRAADMR